MISAVARPWGLALPLCYSARLKTIRTKCGLMQGTAVLFSGFDILDYFFGDGFHDELKFLLILVQ